jgi:uncharacterized protein YqgV (UPF0045/DUF77 family)
MKVAVDISLYPLQEDFEPPIIDFIHHLRQVASIEVHTNELTTQISGEYTLVMNTLRDAMGHTFQQGGTYSFVIKVLNVGIEPGKVVALS